LTDHDSTEIQFEEGGIDLNETITITDFEQQIIDKNLQKIEHYLLTFLAQQHIQLSDIQTVFLTGGTSYIRPLQQIFHRLFGSEKIKSGDNFNSVAIGLAYSYGVLK
jgi:hypothetical chaperone protein